MQCGNCELKNASGAIYCAKCHALMPRPLAPNECRFCGYLPLSDSTLPAACPECGSDAEQGEQIRKIRVARLKASILLDIQTQDAKLKETQRKKIQSRRKKGCLPLLAGILLVLTGTLCKPSRSLPIRGQNGNDPTGATTNQSRQKYPANH